MLSYVTHWPLNVLDELTVYELNYWTEQALLLWEKLNTVPDKK